MEPFDELRKQFQRGYSAFAEASFILYVVNDGSELHLPKFGLGFAGLPIQFDDGYIQLDTPHNFFAIPLQADEVRFPYVDNEAANFSFQYHGVLPGIHAEKAQQSSETLALFVRLAGEAGAALPVSIRDAITPGILGHLKEGNDPHPPCNSVAWWLTLLWWQADREWYSHTSHDATTDWDEWTLIRREHAERKALPDGYRPRDPAYIEQIREIHENQRPLFPIIPTPRGMKASDEIAPKWRRPCIDPDGPSGGLIVKWYDPFRASVAAIERCGLTSEQPALVDFRRAGDSPPNSIDSKRALPGYLNLIVDKTARTIRRTGLDPVVDLQNKPTLWDTFCVFFAAGEKDATMEAWENALKGEWEARRETCKRLREELAVLGIRIPNRGRRLIDDRS